MKNQEIRKPTGTRDIFGKDQIYFQELESIFNKISWQYNFEKIETPIFEKEALFSRGIGQETDIVKKEMYLFESKGGDRLALRPEGTASVVRSYIENDFYTKPQPVKFFYYGPFFRYERPQKGRYRQFYQFGLEILGKKSAALDAQVIQVFCQIFNQIGLKFEVKVNSLGDDNCRPDYQKQLKKFLNKEKKNLCPDCQRRIDSNILRVLDCKNESCQSIIKKSPQIIDNLCKACKKDLNEVFEYLEELKVPYMLDPFLVRGLDYYNNTVFEFFSEGETLALGGGGRYDSLIAQLGGRETPALGGAIGLDRIIDAMKKQKIKPKKEKRDIFLAQLGSSAKKMAFRIFEDFRQAEIPIYEEMGTDSLKSQMNRADKLKVKYALIIGRQELLKNEIILREMKTGKQEIIKIDDLVNQMKKRI